MVGRRTRRSNGRESDGVEGLSDTKIFPQFASAPATEDDKARWRGFCEIESEPTIKNACATVALLNIINNIPNLEIGDNLQAFKDFSATFSPALKGDAIGNFEFVRLIHNSFARKMDMLNADLILKNEATSKAKGKKRKADEDESEPGFHFIAFMPVEDQLWKLDGLERQPMSLGAFEDDWLRQAGNDIEARMAQHEEGHLEFSILGLVRDPLLSLVPRLASNIQCIIQLTARLNALKSDWQELDINAIDGDVSYVLTEPDISYGVTPAILNNTTLPEEIASICQSRSVEEVTLQRQQLITAQTELRYSIKEAQQSDQSDEARAAARRCDYGARMQEFVRRVKSKRLAMGEAEINLE
ncbi:hypothetical protein ACLMJK_000199 [Lecanora helva]